MTRLLLGMVFGNDHFRLMADDSYHLNRCILNTRIDLGIAMFREQHLMPHPIS